MPAESFRSAADQRLLTLVRRFQDLERDIAVRGAVLSQKMIYNLMGHPSCAHLLEVSLEGGFTAHFGLSLSDMKELGSVDLTGQIFSAVVTVGPGQQADELDFEPTSAYYLTQIEASRAASPIRGMIADRFDLAG